MEMIKCPICNDDYNLITGCGNCERQLRKRQKKRIKEINWEFIDTFILSGKIDRGFNLAEIKIDILNILTKSSLCPRGIF